MLLRPQLLLLKQPLLHRSWCRNLATTARRYNSQQASPLQETNNVGEIHKLMAEIRGSYPDSQIRMPNRIAPRRGWAAEVASRQKGSKQTSEQTALVITPEIEASLLKPKHMHDSYVELYLPFCENPELLEKYIATSGLIRLGKVLEDLDTLAGNISYQHALGALPKDGDATAPLYVVTASVDRLDLLEPLVANANYRLCGQVIYVGSSSMEVFVSIEQLNSSSTGPSKICLTGRFTMVARNATTLKGQKIAPLLAETESERALFAIGENYKNRKRAETATSLERSPPSEKEAHLLHQQYLLGLRSGLFNSEDAHGPLRQDSGSLSTGPNGHQIIPVAKTKLETTLHMHPQQRNVHQKVFGGFLMRSAYELAWMTAASFVNRHVHFLSLDALSFHAPVPIGAILQLSSQISFTSEPESGADSESDHCIAAVSVLAEVVDLKTGERKKSNTFHFSYDIGKTNRKVMPQTYKEAMEWIEGKRRVELGNQVRTLYEKDGR